MLDFEEKILYNIEQMFVNFPDGFGKEGSYGQW